MKKAIIVFAVLIVLSLIVAVGYSWNRDVIRHDMTFRGESDSWKGEYKVRGKWIFTEKDERTEFDSHVNGVLIITYIKEADHPPALDHFEIQYDLGPSGGGGLTGEDVVMEKVYRFEKLGTNVPNPDTEMTVTVDMDGDVETFSMKIMD